MCSNEHAAGIDKAVFPGVQGGPLEHVIAAKAVAFGEALQPEFKEWAKQVQKNAKVLAEELIKRGFTIVSGGTDNHSMLVDLRSSSDRCLRCFSRRYKIAHQIKFVSFLPNFLWCQWSPDSFQRTDNDIPKGRF